MTRLIDADALIQIFEEDEKNLVDREFQLAAIGAANTVRKMPTVDAEPVRHGKWDHLPDYIDDLITCSICGETFNVLDNDTYRFNYCPHCGARMDEE